MNKEIISYATYELNQRVKFFKQWNNLSQFNKLNKVTVLHFLLDVDFALDE